MAQWSVDDGATWRSLPTTGRDGGYTVVVPAGRAAVSLRVTATDPSGDSVTQTVIRAYGRR